LTIALSEACTNVMRHASDGLSYRVRLCVDDSRCLMEVRDHGAGFDSVLLPARVLAEDGRGLMIIPHGRRQGAYQRSPTARHAGGHGQQLKQLRRTR
jgi:serine/threonine-protein kinase RsbW